MFFAKPNEYEACGLFGIEHMILLCITIAGISTAVYYTKDKDKKEINNIIKNVTIFLWILEIIKIIFNLKIGNAFNFGTYIPLYFCSLILYAGIFSTYFNGKLKKIGDVFIATGGIIGGALFLISPNTSLTIYPVFHYISIQSFIFHGAMVYLGIIVNITNYVKISLKDVYYYAGFIITTGIIAYVFNYFFDANLMFVSKNYPNTPVEIVYNISGKYFPVVMILGQAILPFYIAYNIIRKLGNKENENASNIILTNQ